MNNPSHLAPVVQEQNTTSGTASMNAADRIEAAPSYHVPTAFYESVRSEVEESLPGMEPDQRYTLAMLCSQEFWHQLSDGDRRKAGICMSDLVAKSLLPLCVAETRHEYPKYYRLK